MEELLDRIGSGILSADEFYHRRIMKLHHATIHISLNVHLLFFSFSSLPLFSSSLVLSSLRCSSVLFVFFFFVVFPSFFVICSGVLVFMVLCLPMLVSVFLHVSACVSRKGTKVVNAGPGSQDSGREEARKM